MKTERERQILDLERKQAVCGLSKSEKQKLAKLQTEPTKTVGAIPADRIRERNAGRRTAAVIVETWQNTDKTQPKTPDYNAAFCETIREYLDQIDPPKKLEPYTDAEADSVGLEPMPFGRYNGNQISLVPLDYLDWLLGESARFVEVLTQYLKNPKIAERLRTELENDNARG